MKKIIELNVNGERKEVFVEENRTLLQVLRDNLGLTGAKKGCELGECGACTVLVDGKAVLSCLTLAIEMQGRQIETIEGLAKDGEIHPLQRSFAENGAIQCGFCTPGMILTAKTLLDSNPNPTREEIKKAIGGNYCRCTGYSKIIDAIENVKKISIKSEYEFDIK